MNRYLIVLLSSLSVLLIACGGDSEVSSEAATEATKVATAAATTTQVVTATASVTKTATAVATEAVQQDLSEYVVVAGDNLTDIAAKYGLTLVQLRALNPDIDGDILWVGQVLKVSGEPPEATATTAPTAVATTAPTAVATTAPTAVATTAPTAVATTAPTAVATTQSGSGQPPFVPYGTNAGANAVVTASANGTVCATTTADEAGQWFFRLEDSCATAGTEITFTSGNKKGTAAYAVGESADIFLDY